MPNYAKSIGGMWDSQVTWSALYLGLVAWEMLGSGWRSERRTCKFTTCRRDSPHLAQTFSTLKDAADDEKNETWCKPWTRMHFFKAHVEEGFLQNNEKRTGDARSHLKPLFAEHSRLTLFSDNRVGHSFVTLLWHTLVGQDTFMGHSCETLLPDTLARHPCGTLWSNTLSLSQYSETLL